MKIYRIAKICENEIEVYSGLFSKTVNIDLEKKNKIENIAKRVRYWNEDSIDDSCLQIANSLCNLLKINGFSPQLVMGTYTVDNPNPSKYSDWEEKDFNDREEMNEAMLYPLHYWVEVEGLIVDVAADQFNGEIDGDPEGAIVIGTYAEYPRYTPQNRRFAMNKLALIDSEDLADERAVEYFNIGHGEMNEEGEISPFLIWVLGYDGSVEKSEIFQVDEEGKQWQGTHGSLWGHDYCNRTYKGRYEIETDKLSIVYPFLGHCPIEEEEALSIIRGAFPEVKKEIIFK